MNESIPARCASIFREITGLANSSKHSAWDDDRLLKETLETLDTDSLTLLEFVMAIEEAYGLELDERDVNNCHTVGQIAELVALASKEQASL